MKVARRSAPFLLFVTILLGMGCTASGKFPKPEVKAGRSSVECVRLGDVEKLPAEGANFAFAFDAGGIARIPTVAIGEVVSIDFGSRPLSRVTVTDVLINSAGIEIYGARERHHPSLRADGTKRTFVLKPHPASDLGSYYKPNAISYRGFLVTRQSGKETLTYAFVLKTRD